jgi:hypothetical protein
MNEQKGNNIVAKNGNMDGVDFAAHFHMKDRKHQYEQVFEDRYRPVLSKKSYHQLLRRLSKPLDSFWQKILLPNSLLDQFGSSIDWLTLNPVEGRELLEALANTFSIPDDLVERNAYAYLSSAKREQGRPQTSTINQLDRRNWRDGSLIDPRDSLSFFTNYLRFSHDSDPWWRRPSERLVIGPYTYFTIEIDPPSEWSIEERVWLLEEQMSWLRRSGDSKKSARIYHVIDWAKQFSDFRAVIATYSGNKSIHFIFVFATADIADGHPELRHQLRPAYIDAFERLSASFQNLLPVEAEHDRNMRFPEQLRRLPNGTHFVEDQEKHLFGVPARTEIPQVVLFEELLSKAPAGADRRFIEPSEIARLAADMDGATKSRSARKNRTLGPWSCEDEQEFCEEKLREEVERRTDPDGYPRLADLVFEGQIKARFYADEEDRNPGVVMFENNASPIVMGGRKPQKKLDLGLPLGHHIARWRKQWRRENPDRVPEDYLKEEDCTVSVIVPEQTDDVTAWDPQVTFRATLSGMLEDHAIILARGAEGLGKTTATMRMIPDLVDSYVEHFTARHEEYSQHHEVKTVLARYSAVATASYEQRDDKCDQYNREIDSKRSIGVRFDSFDRVYQAALEAQYGEDWADFKITTGSAPDLDERAVVRAIQNRQPDVWAEMKRLHDTMMAPVRLATPGQHVVLFMVHDVLHQWTEGGLSRIFANPDFFATPVEHYYRLRDRTGLVVAIHDEVAVEHFIHLAELPDVRWCEDLFATSSVWSEEPLDLVRAKASWRVFKDSSVGAVSFEQCVAIHRSGLSSDQNIGVGPIEKYCINAKTGKQSKIYTARHNRKYAYFRRSWWDGLAEKTILLTTEVLPTAIFEVTSDPDRSAVLDMPPRVTGQGRIEMHILPSLASKENKTLAMVLRETEDLPDAHVLCNNGDGLDNHTTLVSAKGSNSLTQTDIIQIANFVSPGKDDEIGQYDQLQVINAVFGITNALRLWHVDMINQMAGRNLGHRCHGYRHLLAISQTLWDLLQTTLIDHCRYPIDRIEKSERRRNRKHGGDRVRLERLEQEHLDELDAQYVWLERQEQADLDARIDEAAERYRQGADAV